MHSTNNEQTNTQTSNETNTLNNVYVVDEDYKNKLQLYHYKTCDNDSPLDLKEYRGIVKSGDLIVSKSFGYIDELTVDINLNENSKILKSVHSFNQTKIYPMYEGTVLRMFYWKHKWFLSTHKKLNAFDSRWGNSNCMTFGEMFIQSFYNRNNNPNLTTEELWTVFDNFCFQLDVTKTYVFLLLHDENTYMVCNNNNILNEYNSNCFHIGEFDNKTHMLIEGNTSGLPSLPTLSFNTVFDLIEAVRNIDHLTHPGVILYFPNQTQLRLYNRSYKKALELRGNQPDLLFRYLELRKDRELSNEFLELYKNEEQYLIGSELTILDVSKSIFQAYMNRHINKRYVYLPKCEHVVLQLCHKWHKENRDNNKMSLVKVLDVLENLPTKMLYSIIKNHM
jgi:hypothetical protein